MTIADHPDIFPATEDDDTGTEIRFEVDGETVTGGQPGEAWHAVYTVPAHLAESITTEAEAETHDTEPRFERITEEN